MDWDAILSLWAVYLARSIHAQLPSILYSRIGIKCRHITLCKRRKNPDFIKSDLIRKPKVYVETKHPPTQKLTAGLFFENFFF